MGQRLLNRTTCRAKLYLVTAGELHRTSSSPAVACPGERGGAAGPDAAGGVREVHAAAWWPQWPRPARLGTARHRTAPHGAKAGGTSKHVGVGAVRQKATATLEIGNLWIWGLDLDWPDTSSTIEGANINSGMLKYSWTI